jgi:K+-transporting ATPase ATPase C chain
MNISMTQQLRAAAIMLLLFTVVTGLAYPLVVTGAAQLLFSHQANGSLVTVGDKTVGSALIAQPFDDPKYFWSRPSATAPIANNAGASSGSNLGPANPALAEAVAARVAALREADAGNNAPVPVDLVTASGSGLDPHISPAAAEFQAPRVARVRGIPIDDVRRLIAEHTAGRTFGLLGEPRVNVLELNLALDRR